MFSWEEQNLMAIVKTMMQKEWHTDDILSQKHSKFTSLKCPNWCLVEIQNRWSVLIDVLLRYKITAIGPLHILKYPVKQLLRYYQAILTKISRATFQGIKICPNSAIDYEYQGSIQASTESKPTRMKPKNYTRTKTHQNIAETTLYYNLNLLR